MCAMRHVQRVRLLYKTILRLHRGLPGELQALGNGYVRDEFRRHKNASDNEAVLFMNEWTNYAITLANQIGIKGKPNPVDYIGSHLDDRKLDEFKDEQIAQLYELQVAATSSDHKSENEIDIDANKHLK